MYLYHLKLHRLLIWCVINNSHAAMEPLLNSILLGDGAPDMVIPASVFSNIHMPLLFVIPMFVFWNACIYISFAACVDCFYVNSNWLYLIYPAMSFIITVPLYEHLGVSNHWQLDCLIPWPLNFNHWWWIFQIWSIFEGIRLDNKLFHGVYLHFILRQYSAVRGFSAPKKLFSRQLLFCSNAWSRWWHYANWN